MYTHKTTVAGSARRDIDLVARPVAGVFGIYFFTGMVTALSADLDNGGGWLSSGAGEPLCVDARGKGSAGGSSLSEGEPSSLSGAAE